ncbi:MAG: hypothetical protein EXS25_12420 [Pedosphaera sp.]|nr:hypothetical protein [Pedosphaera sp.]
MTPPLQSAYDSLLKLASGRLSQKSLPALDTLLKSLIDLGDSLAAKGTSAALIRDFDAVRDELTGFLDDLELGCETLESAEDAEEEEEAVEDIQSALKRAATLLKGIERVAIYIELNPTELATRSADAIRRLTSLSSKARSSAIDSLLETAKTTREAELLLELVKKAIEPRHSP